jgi:hypothetical protein
MNLLSKVFSILFILIQLPIAFSQNNTDNFNAKVIFGKEYEHDKRNTNIRYMLKDSKGYIYTLKLSEGGLFSKSKNYIERYSPNLERDYEKELIIEGTEGNELNVLNVLLIKGQPQILADYFNKKTERRFLFVLKIDENGSVSKPEKIADFPSTKYASPINIKISEDGTKFLVASMLPPEKKDNDAAQVDFVVLNNEFKEIWKAKTSLSCGGIGKYMSSFVKDVIENNYMNYRFTANTDDKGPFQFAIDNSGKIYALATYERKKESKARIYRIHITKC